MLNEGRAMGAYLTELGGCLNVALKAFEKLAIVREVWAVGVAAAAFRNAPMGIGGGGGVYGSARALHDGGQARNAAPT